MNAATLKMPSKSLQIPEPTIPLGDAGQRLWRELLTEFGDWHPGELRTLNLACVAYQQASDLMTALADPDLDFKQRRQLRADLNAASTCYRQQLRELSLSAQPADARPARIAGRYSGRA